MTQWTALEALVYLAEVRLREEEPDGVPEPVPACRQEIVHLFDGAALALPQDAEEVWAWLRGVINTGGWRAVPDPASRRVYAAWEERVLDTECRAFLDELGLLGVLDDPRRELVVDRVLALDHPDFALEDLCWVVFYVLNGAPGSEDGSDSPIGLPFLPDSDYRH